MSVQKEPPSNWIKASPQALANFFLRCNKEHEFRQDFLKRPLETLEKNDIIVSDEAKTVIKEKVQHLIDKFDDIAIIPDWGASVRSVGLLDDGWGIWIQAEEDPKGIP